MEYENEILDIISINKGITLKEIARKLDIKVANEILPQMHLLRYEGKIEYKEEIPELSIIDKFNKKKSIEKVRHYYLKGEANNVEKI